jgi:hypothetical protein
VGNAERYEGLDPLQTAEYAVNNKLVEQPVSHGGFHMSCGRRTGSSKAAKTRHFRTNQKYGIEIPKTVERAKQRLKSMATPLWLDLLRKEMKAVAKLLKFCQSEHLLQ